MTEPEFHTATMANVYAQQGHYEKAADIYRHLLSQEPDRRDIAEALEAVEHKIVHASQQPSAEDGKEPDLVGLFQKWFRMAGQYRRIVSLKQMKRRVSIRKAVR